MSWFAQVRVHIVNRNVVLVDVTTSEQCGMHTLGEPFTSDD